MRHPRNPARRKWIISKRWSRQTKAWHNRYRIRDKHESEGRFARTLQLDSSSHHDETARYLLQVTIVGSVDFNSCSDGKTSFNVLMNWKLTHLFQDGDDQFREAILDSLKQFYEKVSIFYCHFSNGYILRAIGWFWNLFSPKANILELKVAHQLNNEMKIAVDLPKPNRIQPVAPFCLDAKWLPLCCSFDCNLHHPSLEMWKCVSNILLFVQQKTLEAAKAYCNTYGMQLVSIESVDEQLRIAYFLTKLKCKFHSDPFWRLGIHRRGLTRQGFI